MEDKLKRECRAYVEKTFKTFDKYGSASMPKDEVKNLLKIIIPEFEYETHKEELLELLSQYVKASMPKDEVKNLLKIIIPEFEYETHKEELLELLSQYVKASKYTVHNKQTNQFEVKYLDNTVDFPSVLGITVHFLKKIEMKGQNVFSHTTVVKGNDFPGKNKCVSNDRRDSKRKLY